MVGEIAQRTIGQGRSGVIEELSDEELLAQFLDAADVHSQEAFRVLVERHGPRVLGICRQVLNREHDAEDAFQATFLTLSRNGASIRNGCALAGWLHEVAYRTALKTRARRSRRQTMERQIMTIRPRRDEGDDQGEQASLSELRPILHEEVGGLPDKYRIPVILSYLEGRTNEEVAALLGWPVGTVKGRLSRGRALLRSRLSRRGIALTTAALLVALSRSPAPAAVVPEALVRRTLRRAFGPRIPATAGDLSSLWMHPEPAAPGASASPIGGSSGGPIAGKAPDGRSPSSTGDGADPAATLAQPPSSPLPTTGKDRRPWSPSPMISGALVLLVLCACLLIGERVGSASYGGPSLDPRPSPSRPSPTLVKDPAFSSIAPPGSEGVARSCHPDPDR